MKLKIFHKLYNIFVITIKTIGWFWGTHMLKKNTIKPNKLLSGYTSSQIFYLHSWNGCRFYTLTIPCNGIVSTREHIPNVGKCQGYIIHITKTLKLINKIKTTKNNIVIMGTIQILENSFDSSLMHLLRILTKSCNKIQDICDIKTCKEKNK
jgi:hypothetical protein